MSAGWPAVSYDRWGATCDTLHAHTQVLGKLAVRLAPPEPQLQHAALRLTARGWETAPLPAPDGSGSLVVALDLRAHEAVVEHSGGQVERVPLAPDRPVGEVTREVLAAVARVAGAVQINPRPQEVPWSVPLDEDYEHARYDPGQVEDYFAAATQAALVLAAFRAPYRGRSSPVNAWWGTFDLAVFLFSGLPAEPPSDDFIVRNAADAQLVEVGWWPGDPRHPTAAFFAFAHPAPPAPRRTRTRRRSSSAAQRSATPAWCADGTPAWPPAPREGRPPSGERPGQSPQRSNVRARPAAAHRSLPSGAIRAATLATGLPHLS
jgi:hypothetical protein